MVFKPSKLKEKIKPVKEKPLTPAELKKQREKEKVLKEKILLEKEKTFRKGVISIRDLIAPASMKVTPRYLELGGKFVRTIFVVGYPRYISVGWFNPVITLNATLDVSMFFYKVKTAVVLKQLKTRAGNIEAQLTADAEKGAARNPLLETAFRDIEKLRDDLTEGLEQFFQFALYVTLYADSLKELDDLTEKVESIFGSKLIYTKRAFYQSEQGFNSTLPLGNDELMVTFNMNSSPCASSFPFISAELTSDRGILYGINRHNNSLIIFDRFALPNANEVVFAVSGAGKSYTIKLEVLRSLMFGTDVIIIDPEMEYKTLCDAVGGTYINISLSSEQKINPFDLPRPMTKETSTADIIRSAVINLKGIFKLMVGELTHEEDSLVDRALIETYAKKDIVPGADLATVEPPIMQDLQEVLEGMEGGENLVIRLKKYTEGTFAGLLNYPTNVDMKNQLVIFSVRDLEDELRPVAIYTIVSYIWNVVRSEMKKRILVIDEAWWLMQNEDSAKFIFGLVKRCRKYFLGVTTITQDVADFLESPYGRVIVTQSQLQLLMKQSPAAIDIVAKTFLLTKGERYQLLECGVGEGIFFAGPNHAAIRVVASYSEDQLITTSPQQLLEIEKAKEEFEKELEGITLEETPGEEAVETEEAFPEESAEETEEISE